MLGWSRPENLTGGQDIDNYCIRHFSPNTESSLASSSCSEMLLKRAVQSEFAVVLIANQMCGDAFQIANPGLVQNRCMQQQREHVAVLLAADMTNPSLHIDTTCTLPGTAKFLSQAFYAIPCSVTLLHTVFSLHRLKCLMLGWNDVSARVDLACIPETDTQFGYKVSKCGTWHQDHNLLAPLRYW